MAGITASGAKTTLAAFDLHIVGSVVSYEGWKISPSLVQRILDWPIPTSVTEVRSFLGVAGGGRKWIKGFSLIVKPLTELLRIVTVEFRITEEAIHSQEVIKRLITTTPVLLRLDYDAAKLITRLPRNSDEGLMIVGIDSSWMGAGWAVYQIYKSEKRPTLYGSCTFNSTEQNYGQPKTEVYGVFRAFKELRHRIWGVHFRLDHDALSLAKMLREPDDVPNAPLLRWVAWIRLFDFEPHHVRAESFRVEDARATISCFPSLAPTVTLTKSDECFSCHPPTSTIIPIFSIYSCIVSTNFPGFRGRNPKYPPLWKCLSARSSLIPYRVLRRSS
jgi:hypothetical protein